MAGDPSSAQRTPVVPPLRTKTLDALDAALATSLARHLRSKGPLGLLFSGGLDSSLLAWELRARPEVRLSTVGTAGSPDLAAAEEGARRVGLPWTGSVVTREGVGRVEERIGPELEGVSPVVRSVLVAFAVAVDRAPERALLCGQGADELFLGYAHYRGLGAPDALRRSEADLRRLTEDDWPRSQRIATRWGKSVWAPYLDPTFVRSVAAVPILERLPVPEPKALLRAWARRRGLPESLAGRPKRALQYGSGIDRLLRREPAGVRRE